MSSEGTVSPAPLAPLHVHLEAIRGRPVVPLDDMPPGYRPSRALLGFLWDDAWRMERIVQDIAKQKPFDYLTALRHGWIRQLEEIGAMKKVAPEDVEAEVAHVREHGAFTDKPCVTA